MQSRSSSGEFCMKREGHVTPGGPLGAGHRGAEVMCQKREDGGEEADREFCGRAAARGKYAD